VRRPVRRNLEIEPPAEGILRDFLAVLELGDVQIHVVGGARYDDRPRRQEARAEYSDRRDGSSPCRVTWDCLDDVLPGGQPIAFITAEKERAILHDRTAE